VFGEFVGLLALLLLAGVLFYRIAAALTLRYEVDRNGLYIRWIGNRAVVPLSAVEHIEPGATGVRLPVNPLRHLGYTSGQGRTAEHKPVNLFLTRPLRKSLVIYTADAAYAVSPARQEAFVQELEQRRRIGAVKPLAPTVEPGRVFFYAFWHDPLIRWSLLIAFGLNLLLFGVLALNYPDLAAQLDMRFDPTGVVTEQRPRHQVLFIPMAAFGLSLLNTGLGLSFYRRDRTGAQMLQLGSVLIQVLFGIALLAIIT
jgi:hypothetical protein